MGIEATVSRDISWIRAHILIALLAVVLIAGTIIGGVALFEHLVEAHDARVAAEDLAKNQVDTATQAALMNQLTQMQAADAAREAANTALIKSLVGQMAVSRAATTKQVATDNTLDAAAAAQRLITQTKAAPGEVTVVNNSLLLDLPLARVVVADLDLLAQAQSDVTNLTGQRDAQIILTNDAKAEADKANQVIAADKVELIAAVKADQAACVVSTNIAVDAQKKKDNKHAVWSAIGGFIGGFFLGRKF